MLVLLDQRLLAGRRAVALPVGVGVGVGEVMAVVAGERALAWLLVIEHVPQVRGTAQPDSHTQWHIWLYVSFPSMV